MRNEIARSITNLLNSAREARKQSKSWPAVYGQGFYAGKDAAFRQAAVLLGIEHDVEVFHSHAQIIYHTETHRRSLVSGRWI